MDPEIETHLFANERILRARFRPSEELNASLVSDLEQGRRDFTYSHKINGRWENTYLSIQKISQVREIVGHARDLVFRVLEQRLLAFFHPIKSDANPPFWFNRAEPGEITGVHDHAKPAVISGVYYVSTTQSSGDLFFQAEGEKDFFLSPIEGTLVLFPSHLRHGVTENLSESTRISLAFNLFRLPLEIF